MMRSKAVRWVCCALGTLVLTSSMATGQSVEPDARGFIAVQPEDVRAVDGSILAVILGDSSKPGMYVVRVTFAPGQGSRPHFHSQDRYVTVIRGTWWVALGPDSDVYNPDRMVPMKPGSFVFHPANAHHYDGAKDEEVVVQVIGMGPVTTTMLDSERGRGQ